MLAFLQWRDGTHHARILLWGTLLLTVTLFHDILVGWGLIAVRPAFPWLTLVGSIGFVASLALTTAEKFVESETAALYDRLTGLYRREVVMDALSREIRRASRTRQPLAVIMLDVDRFKQLNDSLGHQGGDKVLTEIGRRMIDAGRAVDWLGRYGGEEFIAVLASTEQASALLAAERLRAAVSALPIATGRTTRTVTLSAGVATYEGGPEWPTVEQLVGAADAALYRAKNSGRTALQSRRVGLVQRHGGFGIAHLADDFPAHPGDHQPDDGPEEGDAERQIHDRDDPHVEAGVAVEGPGAIGEPGAVDGRRTALARPVESPPRPFAEQVRRGDLHLHLGNADLFTGIGTQAKVLHGDIRGPELAGCSTQPVITPSTTRAIGSPAFQP